MKKLKAFILSVALMSSFAAIPAAQAHVASDLPVMACSVPYDPGMGDC